MGAMSDSTSTRRNIGLGVFFGASLLGIFKAIIKALGWAQDILGWVSGDTGGEAARSFGGLPMLSAESINSAANVLILVLILLGLYLIFRSETHDYVSNFVTTGLGIWSRTGEIITT